MLSRWNLVFLVTPLMVVAGCAAPVPQTADRFDLLPSGSADAGDLAGSDGGTIDLAGVDLAGVDLAGIDLAGIDLAQPVDLAQIDLSHVDLSHIDMTPPCVPGTVCTTSNPGACAAGTISCGSGTPVCNPTVTTQSCYSGASGTAGKGVCKAGTQSCIGSLGTCSGQVTPTTENCFNSTDDDCDGNVNNGCPVSISLGTSTALPSRGGTGGSANTALCAAGQVVVGAGIFDDDDDGKVAGLGVYCAPISLVKGAIAYSLALGTTVAEGGFAAGNAGNLDEEYCTTGDVAFGQWSYSDNFVEGAAIECASNSLTLNPTTNKLTVTWTFSDGPHGIYYDGGTLHDDYCPAGSVLVGFDARDGAYLDEMQGLCAPINVSYQ